MRRALSIAGLCAFLVRCSAPPATHVLLASPSPPPIDDGQASSGMEGGMEHAQALEELKVAELGWATDRQHSLRLLLPDARHWLRVKFWATKSLVAFRYGKDHHSVVGGFVIHVPDETVQDACNRAFEQWAKPWMDLFEVEIAHDPPQAAEWREKIIDIDPLVATTATLGMHDQYASAYAIYPAWAGACLVVGVAVPARGELERARAVRDRFATEVLPRLQVISPSEPKESY
jgi:hypothetical protein